METENEKHDSSWQGVYPRLCGIRYLGHYEKHRYDLVPLQKINLFNSEVRDNSEYTVSPKSIKILFKKAPSAQKYQYLVSEHPKGSFVMWSRCPRRHCCTPALDANSSSSGFILPFTSPPAFLFQMDYKSLFSYRKSPFSLKSS